MDWRGMSFTPGFATPTGYGRYHHITGCFYWQDQVDNLFPPLEHTFCIHGIRVAYESTNWTCFCA